MLSRVRWKLFSFVFSLNSAKVNLIMSELFFVLLLFRYKTKGKMLVDNKVYLFVEEFSRLEDRLVANVFPFQKRVQIQLQHACIRAFTLDLSFSTTIKPIFFSSPCNSLRVEASLCLEGKQRNQIDLAWWKSSGVSLSRGNLSVHRRTHSKARAKGHFPRAGYFPSADWLCRLFTSRFTCAFWILLTETRWKNHDRSKYSTRQSRLARNDISVVLAFAV